ncbi:Na+/H+ antiporter NhaA [Sinorhizobium fredii]
MNDSLSRLPREPADRLTKPFMRFLRIEATAGIILLLSTLWALGLANTAWSSSFLALWEMPAGVKVGDVELSPFAEALDQRRSDDALFLRHRP